MFIDKVKNFCDHSMILREMAANQKPIGTLWPPPASFRVKRSDHSLTNLSVILPLFLKLELLSRTALKKGENFQEKIFTGQTIDDLDHRQITYKTIRSLQFLTCIQDKILCPFFCLHIHKVYFIHQISYLSPMCDKNNIFKIDSNRTEV